MKIGDLLEVKKESFFNGAVQAEWFYDSKRRNNVAESYIFHGPKYHGVSRTDKPAESHELIDTLSYVETIYKKINDDLKSNRFLMTIAVYGTGKSHLSVTLASLLSGADRELQNNILNNIKNIDENKYNNIKKYTDEQNLVLVINGINDVNLNSEILKTAKNSLKMYGLDTDIFEDITSSYKTAQTFLENTYENCENKYLNAAQNTKFQKFSGGQLKENLKKNVQDNEAYEIINKIYIEITGKSIKVDEVLSASMILNRLHQKYVIEEKKFKSIIIIFDEFGRYLEFASDYPSRSGDAALQQIYESVQNASPDMLFIGFIQSELNTYISRVQNDNIKRYVGRYQNSDKYYLSSNLETVLANIIKRKNNAEKVIKNIYEGSHKTFSSRIHANILRWQPRCSEKGVWNNKEMFKNVILEGCYPLHPITVEIMIGFTEYMQQRSTLSFFTDKFMFIKDKEITNEKIPFIYPVDYLKSPIFNDLLNAEERRRLPGQNVSLYREMIDQYEEVLTESDKDVLIAILISEISRFKTFDRKDAELLIESLADIQKRSLEMSLKHLEQELGIIGFNSMNNRFEFISNGSSKIDFNRLLNKKLLTVKPEEFLFNIPEEIADNLKFEQLLETDFGRKNDICTPEWSFTKEFINIKDFSLNYMKIMIKDLEKSIEPENSKGIIIYLYVTPDTYNLIEEVKENLKICNLEDKPVIIGIINDENEIIKDSMCKIRALNAFNNSEKESFKKYYLSEKKQYINNVIKTFTKLSMNKQYLNKDGIIISKNRIEDEISNKFEKIYFHTVPFSIDGFEKKVTPKVRKNYNSIIEILLAGKLDDRIEYEILPKELQNRIEEIFSVEKSKSWKVFYNLSKIGKPLNSKVNYIFEKIKDEFNINKKINVNEWITVLTKAPYGMNIYSAVLFLIYFIYVNKKNIALKSGTCDFKFSQLKELFNDDKKDKFNDFKKLKINYVEEKEGKKYLALCEQYKNEVETTIDNAIKVYEEFKKLDLAEIDISDRDVINAYMATLKSIEMKNNDINKILKTAEEELKYLEAKPMLARKHLIALKEIKAGTIKGCSYSYSLGQIEKSEKLQKEYINALKKIIPELADKYSLDNKKLTEKYLNTLRSYFNNDENKELVDLIDAAKKVCTDKLNKIKEIKNYFEELDRQLKRLEDNLKAGHLAEESKEAADAAIIKIDTKKIFSKEILGRREKFVFYKEKFTEKLEEEKSIIDECDKKIENCHKCADIDKIINQNNFYINKNILAAAKDELMKRNKVLLDIKESFAPVYHVLTSKQKIEKISDKLLKKYDNKLTYDILNRNLKKECIDYIENEEKIWIKKYIIDFQDLNKFDVKALKKWQTEADQNLEHFSEACREMYEATAKRIEEAIKQLNIECIEYLFNELNENQKKECLKKLNSLMGVFN